jgi:hypothetical protein
MRNHRAGVGVGGLVLLAGLGGQACSDEETGLFIQGAMSLTAPQCSLRADPGSPLLLGGNLDVTQSPTYLASLLVGNQLTPRGDKQNLRTETMITTITGAEVRLLDDVGALVTEFTVPASGVILPDDGSDPGYGIVDVTLIPGSEGVALREQLVSGQQVTRVAEASVFGSTIGGLEVESARFVFVIRVCEDCLFVECDPDEELLSCRTGQDSYTCVYPP